MDTRTENESPEEGAVGEGDAPPAAERRLGHFLLGEKLGQGGMGVVYAADDLRLHRRVAIKILPAAAADSPERRRRFLREARSASAFVHPNVAAVFEIGEDGDDLFLVMEHVAGRTLRDLLRARGGPLALPEALAIARDVARGVARAHRAGIVHRDLKPENVMIAADGSGAKVLDFGVARLLSASLDAPAGSEPATIEGRILGTPGYMAPEQGRGLPVDARADVFSFGVLLHEMLTGARPFGGDTAVARLAAVERDAPASLASRSPAVPAAIARIVARCLEKRPEDRFASCAEVADALDGAPAGPAPRTAYARRVVILAPVLLGVAGLAAFRLSRAPATAPAAAVSSAARGRPCPDADGGAPGCSRDGAVAWCDLAGKPLACCGRGLVPVGADGICGCAPGGTRVPQAIARGCAPPPPGREEEAGRAKAGAVQRAIACFVPLVDAGKIDGGTFEAQYVLSPDGEVASARVLLSTLPNEDAQACALAALRGTRFPPPAGEEVGEPITFGFELASRAELRKPR